MPQLDWTDVYSQLDHTFKGEPVTELNLAAMRDRNWDFDKTELLYAYVGQTFKWSDLPAIRAMKAQEATHVAAMLGLTPDDVVADIGSGFGHVALALAPKVQRYVCADISGQMMEICKAETAHLGNVEHAIVPRADIGALAGRGINKIFFNSVLIHVVMFELVAHLRKAYEILPSGGQLYFNFCDADYLGQADDPWFNDMLSRFIRDPLETTLMHWNSFTAVRAVAQRTGFELSLVKKGQYGTLSVTFVKP